MRLLTEIMTYILSFKPYVLLPVLLFLLSLIFGVRIGKAFKASLLAGIGFVGMFVFFDFFVQSIGPMVKEIVKNTGLSYSTFDVGWTPLAALAWSFKYSMVFVVIILVVNIIMLILMLTKTLNVDLWNFWHLNFLGCMVFHYTNSLILAIISVVFCNVLVLKTSDFSYDDVVSMSGLEGISITTFSALSYYYWGVIGNRLIDKSSSLSKIDLSPEKLKKKIGVLGEPYVTGFIIGFFLSIIAGYDVKQILESSVVIAAIIYLIPLMANILAQGLTEISDGIKDFMKKRFPQIDKYYIGVDLAVLLGNPSAIVTGVILIPFALLFAFLIPGITFIPLGELGLMGAEFIMITVASKGNIFRSVVLSIPMIVINLLVATNMANLYTDLLTISNISFGNYEGTITSFLNGGNLIRTWIVKLFTGELFSVIALILLVTVSIIVKRKQKHKV